jgi:hypothetical protein
MLPSSTKRHERTISAIRERTTPISLETILLGVAYKRPELARIWKYRGRHSDVAGR